VQRVTVNPKNGRSEYIFVNLEALYPNTDSPRTELSFEELIADHRGWLNKVWKPETSHGPNESPEVEHKMDKSNLSGDALTGEISNSLIAIHDPDMLDENGVANDPGREGRARKMKIKEINETQISES
jgi:checkpoint serine/threonine-protein kinase